RYEASPTQPTSIKAFLSAIVTRIAIDVLRSARSRREAYGRAWLPAPHTHRSLSPLGPRIAMRGLRSARSRREAYGGPWFPEPLLTDPYEDPERSAELADSVSMAALGLLERLSPLGGAVFVRRVV